MPPWLRRTFKITDEVTRARYDDIMKQIDEAKVAVKRAAGTSDLQTATEELQELEQAAEDYLSKVPEDQRTYGIISVGAALGDDEYVQMYLQEKGDELCAEGDGIIDRIATGLASKSEQAANVASVLSLQERINYLAGTHMPSEWDQGATTTG